MRAICKRRSINRPVFERWLVAPCAAVLFCSMAFGGQMNRKDASKAAATHASAAASTKKQIDGAQNKSTPITLLDATRVSTAGALHAAAEAKSGAAKNHAAPASAAGVKPAADSGVMEFQTAASTAPTGGQTLTQSSKSSKDSLLKDVHGDVYGATAAGPAGGSAEGGAVGAKSKSGKTSIYVQTDHSQGVPPR